MCKQKSLTLSPETWAYIVMALSFLAEHKRGLHLEQDAFFVQDSLQEVLHALLPELPTP